MKIIHKILKIGKKISNVPKIGPKKVGLGRIPETRQFLARDYFRPPDKNVRLKLFFLISQLKHILWVLQRTVAVRRFF